MTNIINVSNRAKEGGVSREQVSWNLDEPAVLNWQSWMKWNLGYREHHVSRHTASYLLN